MGEVSVKLMAYEVQCAEPRE